MVYEPDESGDGTAGAAEGAAPADGSDVRARLRSIRLHKGLAIETVAAKAGVSKSFLSRFERDLVQTSVATLLRLCQAMDVRPGELFEPPQTSFVPAGRGTPLNLGGRGMSETLISGPGRHMMALDSVIGPGGGSGDEAYSLRADADLVHVKTGMLEVSVGHEVHRLGSGDTLTVPPTIPHTWRNPSDTEVCTALFVIVPPPT